MEALKASFLELDAVFAEYGMIYDTQSRLPSWYSIGRGQPPLIRALIYFDSRGASVTVFVSPSRRHGYWSRHGALDELRARLDEAKRIAAGEQVSGWLLMEAL